jgi:hypothetical protein
MADLTTIHVPLDADLAGAVAFDWPTRMLIQILRNQLTHGAQIMATIQDVATKLAAEDAAIASVVTLLGELSSDLKALKPDQASIDALAAKVDAHIKTLNDAAAANALPAAPPAPAA